MWPEDDPEKTELEWKVDFRQYGQTIDDNPRGTIAPRGSGRDAARRGALKVLEHLVAAGVAPMGGRLELAEVIGTGGVGIVRKARQTALARDVAVKMLRPKKRSEETIADLLHEAWITGSLEHPNIIPVHDILLDDDGSPIIVLKRIEGVAWSELIRDGQRVRELFGAEDLLEWNLGILTQVLNALRFAHSRGIVHRDLKPDNVMIGQFGEVCLVDWGLAVSLNDDETGRLPLARNATSLAGTPAYMAPEMIGDSEIPITARTDIYLAGAVLHEILSGHPPHTGKDALAIIGSVVQSNPRFSPDVPDGLARICRRAMDADPHGRFENAEQVRLAIQGFLRHRGSALLSQRAEAALGELVGELGRSRRPGRRPSQAGRAGQSGHQTLRKEGTPERPDNDATDVEHRQHLYRLFGACRFGFREALVTWPHNDAARVGLERATMAMIEHELAQGDPRAAAALFAELPEPSAGLRQRIDQAIEADASHQRRAAELAQLGRQLDIRTGQRPRALATLALGVSLTIVPTLTSWLWPVLAYDSHPKVLTWTTLWAAVTLLIGYFIRTSLRESAVNRRLYSLLLLLVFASYPLQVGLWTAGFQADETILVHVFIWFFLAAIIALTFDARLLPAACGYLATFFVMAWAPDLRLYIFNLPHAILTINYVVAWRTR